MPRSSGLEMVVRLRWPRTNDQVISAYEGLVDEFGQTAGDGFLRMCENEARRRGLVDSRGRRKRKR